MSFIRNNLLNGFMIAATGAAGFGMGNSMENVASQLSARQATDIQAQIDLNIALESHGEDRTANISDLNINYSQAKASEFQFRDTNAVAYTLAASFACLSWFGIMVGANSKESELRRKQIPHSNNEFARRAEIYDHGFEAGAREANPIAANILHSTASALGIQPSELSLIKSSHLVSLLKYAVVQDVTDPNKVNADGIKINLN